LKTIPLETVDRIWTRINEGTPEETQRLVERMGAKQPFILAYLMAIDERLTPKNNPGSLLMLGFIVWHIMSSSAPNLRQVTPEEIETAEELNVLQLEQMEEDSEINFQKAALKLFATYNQMPLLGAVLEALMEEVEESSNWIEDETGMAFLYIKSVIDCLDQ
jgi:hypothetical protein